MLNQRIKKVNFRLGARNQLKDSGWSILFGVFSGILFIGACVYSGINRGEAGLLVGALGIIAMIADIYGFYLAVKSLKGDDIYFLTALIGVVLNGLMFALYIILMIVGFMV
ncbi:MAG: hypothetical protein IJD02_04315 [Lachnospiraceae bacterium]|nr:hypothetical protein [Lachnospiraceae bacterium]